MLEGRVTVNGVVVRELGTRVQPHDVIAVDGQRVVKYERKQYVVVNKPVGHVTTTTDPQRRPTVVGLVPAGRRLYPVGRLDAGSEGLLLLTDDGDLAYRMTHPRYGIEKEYQVQVASAPSEMQLRQMREGIELDGRATAPAKVELVAREGEGTWLNFVIHEGRKRQIRRMCEAVGLSVVRLIRTRVGPLLLKDLPSGACRELTSVELRALMDTVGHGPSPLTIAIDGPAGSGKSALALCLAERFHLLYLDTGAMYRTIALLALRRGIDPRDEKAVSHLAEVVSITIVPANAEEGLAYAVLVDGQDVTAELYTSDVGAIVSIVSAFPRVRVALVLKQREIAAHTRAVVVGRDIGTVVLPAAPIKIYLDASEEVRARRREDQLRERGIMGRHDEVLAEIRLRDKLDSEREDSPLAKAPGAVVLNTDHLTVDEEAALVGKRIMEYEEGQD